VSAFVSPGSRSWLYRAKAPRNHNPRIELVSTEPRRGSVESFYQAMSSG
jgi:hypothetical protein